MQRDINPAAAGAKNTSPHFTYISHAQHEFHVPFHKFSDEAKLLTISMFSQIFMFGLWLLFASGITASQIYAPDANPAFLPLADNPIPDIFKITTLPLVHPVQKRQACPSGYTWVPASQLTVSNGQIVPISPTQVIQTGSQSQTLIAPIQSQLSLSILNNNAPTGLTSSDIPISVVAAVTRLSEPQGGSLSPTAGVTELGIPGVASSIIVNPLQPSSAGASDAKAPTTPIIPTVGIFQPTGTTPSGAQPQVTPTGGAFTATQIPTGVTVQATNDETPTGGRFFFTAFSGGPNSGADTSGLVDVFVPTSAVVNFETGTSDTPAQPTTGGPVTVDIPATVIVEPSATPAANDPPTVQPGAPTIPTVGAFTATQIPTGGVFAPTTTPNGQETHAPSVNTQSDPGIASTPTGGSFSSAPESPPNGASIPTRGAFTATSTPVGPDPVQVPSAVVPGPANDIPTSIVVKPKPTPDPGEISSSPDQPTIPSADTPITHATPVDGPATPSNQSPESPTNGVPTNILVQPGTTHSVSQAPDTPTAGVFQSIEAVVTTQAGPSQHASPTPPTTINAPANLNPTPTPGSNTATRAAIMKREGASILGACVPVEEISPQTSQQSVNSDAPTPATGSTTVALEVITTESGTVRTAIITTALPKSDLTTTQMTLVESVSGSLHTTVVTIAVVKNEASTPTTTTTAPRLILDWPTTTGQTTSGGIKIRVDILAGTVIAFCIGIMALL